MDLTPKGFKKPLAIEAYNVEIQNSNMDLADSLITGIEQTMENIELIATNINIDDTSNNFTATNVEGALAELFQSVANGKDDLYSALVTKGLNPMSRDFQALYNAIMTDDFVRTIEGDALASHILLNKKAIVDGNIVIGSMPNNGAVAITPGTTNKAIAAGYHNGNGYVVGDADLISANIKAGANIFGVLGNTNVVDTSAGDATAAQILSDKKAYVDGALVTGTIPSQAAQIITPSTVNQTIAAGRYLSGAQTILGDANLVPGNIVKGKSIFGKTGTTEALIDTQLFAVGNTSYLNWEKIGNGTVAITSSSIRLTPGWSDYATAVTKNQVDLTDIKAIVAFVKVTSGGNGMIRLGADVSKFIVTQYANAQPAYQTSMLALYPNLSNVPIGEFLMLLDVNQLTGLHYIYLFSNLANSGHTEYFYNIQFIK